MKTKLLNINQAFALLMLPALLGAGCATPALWKNTAAREWQPREVPDHLLVATRTGRQDVIVVFQQRAAIGDKHKDRLVAWDLRQPPTELAVGRGAVRQLTNACESIRSMPVFSSDEVPANASSTPPGYAAREPSCGAFTVHLEGAPSGPFELPVSHVKRRSFARIAVAPFAITADAVIIAAAITAMGAGGAQGVGAM